MAYSYDQIIQSNYEALQGDLARTNGELEHARLNEDASGVMWASQRILEIRRDLRELDQVAREAFAQRQPRGDVNKYGLSADEIQIAHGMSGGDRSLSNDDRQRMYAEQKARYQHMRQTGEYRDDQGMVRR